ncbi:hypothetical protein [Streptomyces goshikiensis]|uniref:hypothetical protein n=1 Tax=Streptomyces goshikiensis TaxID=1942 RepID=UPI002E0FC4E9|nr:hypothetical protein OG224_06935 [Streptomyces goshikiensis]
MSDIIAGDPAPTNPTFASRRSMTADDRLQVMIRTDRGHMTVWSEPEVRDALDAFRAEVLAEAISAASAEYEPQDLLAVRSPYNEGVSDAVSALYRLRNGGAR